MERTFSVGAEMKEPSHLVLISRRITELQPASGEGNIYCLAPTGFSGYGEEEWMLREFYGGLLPGYRHALVRIEGQECYSLGLLPPEGSSASAYVEIDDLANPIPVKSAEGLRAVQLVEQTIREGAKGEDELLDQLVDASKNEDITLRLFIFRRLREHFLKIREEAGVPSILFRLLPWDEVLLPVRDFLRNAVEVLNKEKEKIDWARLDQLLATPIPRLGYYFNYIEGGLAYQMGQLARSLKSFAQQRRRGEDGFEPLVESIAKFIHELELTPIEIVEAAGYIGKLFVRLPDNLALFLRDESHRRVEGGELFQRELWTKINFAAMRGFLLVHRVKQLSPVFGDLRSQVRNPADAALVADRGKFFEDKPWYLSELLERMRETVDQIPREPEALLENSSFNKVGPEEDLAEVKFNGLLNAADVCRLYARSQFQIADHDPNYLLGVVETSERYYIRGEQFLADTPLEKKSEKQNMLRTRYGELLLLKLRNVDSLGKTKEARDTERVINKLVKELTSLTLPEFGDRVNRQQLLVALVESLGATGQQDRLIVREAERLLRERPADARPYEILFRYYTLRKDIEKATEVLDRQRKMWEESRQPIKAIQWLQYRSALVCSEAARESGNVSLVLEAIRRYGEVLRDQESNLKAAYEVVELLKNLPGGHLEVAFKELGESLKKLTQEECPLIHAMIRILFTEEQVPKPSHVKSVIDALLVLVAGSESLLPDARACIMNITIEQRKQLGFVVENISKMHFDRGCSTPRGAEFVIAERLIDLWLDCQKSWGEPLDRVLQTRKVDIALRRRDDYAARQILSQVFSPDPILKLKAAQLARHEGRSKEAQSILEKVVELESGRVHSAVLNELALSHFHQGNFDKAEALYTTILKKNELDPIARFGLGRVYFERGLDYWPGAFAEWLRALRLRSSGKDYRDFLLAQFTARSLAGLCREGAQDTKIGQQILSELGEAIQRESPAVSSKLIDGLAAIGALDEEVVRAVREASAHIEDVVLASRVAQYLMVRTIYLTLGAETAVAKEKEILASLEWCLKKKVLPEHLAGAKGSYARALLIRVASPDGDKYVDKMLDPAQISEFERSLNSRLREFYQLICRSDEYIPDYYKQAYQLWRPDMYSEILANVQFLDGLVRGVAHSIWKAGWQKDRGLRSLLDGLYPSISLWPLRMVIGAQDGTSQMGGWVDLDSLLAVKEEFWGNGWCLADSVVQREIPALPEERDALLYSKYGVFFKVDKDKERAYCYIDTTGMLETTTEVAIDAE